MDFEGYSAAGFVWHGPTAKKPLGYWTGPPGAASGKKGLNVIGSRVYSEHPSTEALTFSYDLKDGRGTRRWKPGQPNPQPLFDHLDAGKLVEAHGAGFELNFWNEVCVHRYGWPPLDGRQLRCSMAKARAFGLPAALVDVGEALNLDTQKDKAGKELMKIFSWPKDPTKKDPRWRILPEHEPEKFARYEDYCDTDIHTESGVSARCPDLPQQELDYWLADQAINRRGIGVDMAAVRDCIAVVNEVLKVYDDEMHALIGLRASQAKALVKWFADNGVVGQDGKPCKSLAEKDGNLEFLYESRNNYPWPVGRVLELRCLCASASVKKVFSMANHASRDSRLCDLFIYHGARTGRDTHADVQPGNLPKAGPDLRWCDNQGICNRPYAKHFDQCPWCGCSAAFSSESSPVDGDKGWCFEAVDSVLEVLQMRSMHALEMFFGDALLCISGVVRSLLVAKPGHRLICSDYASIEAVVSAVLTGEEWRVEAFRRKEDIYLHGAAGVTGKTYEWYKENGFKKHPDRQKIGKPAELGLGFGGFSGALFAFGFEGDKAEADKVWMAWRAASPAFEEMWGGQYRGVPWRPTSIEFFGLEGAAVNAVLKPGELFFFRGITYQVLDDVLYCTLLSGRRMAYHQPRLWYGAKRDGWVECYSLTYMTWNTNAKMGPKGWVRMETYGGRLFENVVQATARDIMAHAVVNLERAGYPVVLRVHDEVAAEVPDGFGSLEEFEAILTDLPAWAKGWPIRAAGWAGVRYHKD
jgi:DNA polymerase I - 3''-5'' exonuclease and polymerase domains